MHRDSNVAVRLFASSAAGGFHRVNSVNPGMVETEGTNSSGITEGEMRRQTEASTPLSCIGQPQDIAPVVVFLASADSGWITGEAVYVSGGLR